MRLTLLALLLASGCANLKKMLPGTAVLSASELESWAAPRAAEVTYTSPAAVDFPVIPLQVFGVHYDLDIVLVSQHPSWDMHEYARIQTPTGPVWLAKDADTSLVQTIVADLPDLESRIAEVPVPRQISPVVVDDRSEGRNVDVTLDYTNTEGEPVHVSYQGTVPKKPPPKRNGNTMGHSRHAVAVVLDLARMGVGGKAKMEIGGEPVKLDRLMGFLRQRYILEQTQGGVAVASFRQQPREGGGFVLVRPGAGAHDPATGAAGWPTHRTEAWTQDGDTAWFDDGWTKQSLQFVEGGLARASVHQAGRTTPVFELMLDPALPNLTRRFDGVAESQFRMDVNGQAGHGRGTVRAHWVEDDVVIDFVPLAPKWLTDRAMTGRVSVRPDGAVMVETQRQ
jgi:hypothetical protein